LTGIHLMRTGGVEANLVRLNETFHLPQIPDLIALKLAGPERSALPNADIAFHRGEYERLCAELERAAAASRLPDQPTSFDALDALLIRLRLGSQANRSAATDAP
jgi:hypothetical protein